MNIKTYYCYIPIEAKVLLKTYVDSFKLQTGRSVILTPAKYTFIDSGLTTAQNEPINEQSNIKGFCLMADETDIKQVHLELIAQTGGQVFDNSEEYLNFINTI